MTQQVDVKGFGLVEFPDNIERGVMLDALRRKFSQINQGQAVANSTAEPYNPGLAERAASAISSGLQKTGLISDNYRANRIGENITMGLEALPVIGDAIGGDELGRAIREGDVIGGGFAALGAIPIAGDAAKAVGGSVKRLYHGSPVEFDEFDPARVGDRMTSLGLGHYLTPNKDMAKQYGDKLMEFDVDTSGFLDWGNLGQQDRSKIESALMKVVPSERIAHFGQAKYEILPRGKEGAARFKQLKEKTKDAYNDYAKARILDDDDIERIDPELFSKLGPDDVVVGWKEGGNLSSMNSQQLMTVMNEYAPDLAKQLGYKGSVFGEQVAIYDPKLAKKANPQQKPMMQVGDAAKAAGAAGGKLITSVSDLFDYTPDMLANQLKKSDPSKVVGEAWRDQKRAFYTDYLPDGSAEMYKNDGTLIKRMEPEEAKRLYRERILEIETQKPEAQAILEKRRLDDEAAARAQREASESDYRMMHRAPTRDGNLTADDVSGLFDDIYGPNALRLNSTGAPYDRKAIQIIQSMRGNPDKEITIYRAVPKGIKDINQGDWVTATKEYAEQHAKYDPSYVVISKKVKARDIATDGNSIHEFGYDPQQNPMLQVGGKLSKDDAERWQFKTNQLRNKNAPEATIKSDYGNILVFDESDDSEMFKQMVLTDSNGDAIATLFAGEDAGKMVGSIEVRPDMRRKGIATKLYDEMEKLTGLKMKPADKHSKDAEAFWKSRRGGK